MEPLNPTPARTSHARLQYKPAPVGHHAVGDLRLFPDQSKQIVPKPQAIHIAKSRFSRDIRQGAAYAFSNSHSRKGGCIALACQLRCAPDCDGLILIRTEKQQCDQFLVRNRLRPWIGGT
jgi:hypothetical protein